MRPNKIIVIAVLSAVLGFGSGAAASYKWLDAREQRLATYAVGMHKTIDVKAVQNVIVWSNALGEKSLDQPEAQQIVQWLNDGRDPRPVLAVYDHINNRGIKIHLKSGEEIRIIPLG